MTNALHPTGHAILDYLNSAAGARSSWTIAYTLAMPQASVRRWIGTLRDRGFNIQTTTNGYKFSY